MAITVKKKNPQDATLRNVRAAVKRLAALEQTVATMKKQVHHLQGAVVELAAYHGR